MPNTVFIVLGNGFSISLIQLLKKEDAIDLRNLFSKGDSVPWPDNSENGFLSRKYCKNLWTLGARTTMTSQATNQFIGNIITCLNVFAFATAKAGWDDMQKDNIYIAAHNELSTYLKNLFLYYNSLVIDDDLAQIANEIPLLKYIKAQRKKGNEVVVITYNYDIFLERLLSLAKVPFNIAGFTNSNAKVQLVKPHGSISFVSKKTTVGKTFEIKSTLSSMVTEIDELELNYSSSRDFSLVNAIIPPAGDSNRLNKGWVKTIRTILNEQIRKADNKDTLLIYGLSYDHVDRIELDEIITSISSEVNVKYINPFPSETFDAVLSSIFPNYIHLKDCERVLEA